MIDLLQMAVAAAGAESSPAMAATRIRLSLNDLTSLVREQVGRGEFGVDGAGRPTITTMAVVGPEAWFELVHLPAHGRCGSEEREAYTAIGPAELLPDAERAARLACLATDTDTARQLMIEAVDRASRMRPQAVSRDWESLTVRPSGVDHHSGSLPMVKPGIPRH